MTSIDGTSYEIDSVLLHQLDEIQQRVSDMRAAGKLTAEVLGRLRQFFKIKNIYNSNAIEGNSLDVGETRVVVEQGLTIAGRPLKDQAEARNLSEAIDYLEVLAKDSTRPLGEVDIRQIHYLVLKDVRNADAGKYRNVPVEISGSEFKPPPPEQIASKMQEFGRWLADISVAEVGSHQNALLLATAAHTWFVTVHPFVDGNGRVGRLILNLILMRYRYPIAIITTADRSRYYDALEISQTSDLTAITSLVAECLEESLEEYETAAREQHESKEWAQSLVGRFQKNEQIRAANQYEVWRSAMELLKSVFRQTAEMVDSRTPLGHVYFKDFGHLELEKYIALKGDISAKKTWFFRIDFRMGERSARYLFFFGFPSYHLRPNSDVTLHVAREEPSGSFNFERLESISAPNVPQLVEIAYDAKNEEFIARKKQGGIARLKIEQLCRGFFEDVVQKHFDS